MSAEEKAREYAKQWWGNAGDDDDLRDTARDYLAGYRQGQRDLVEKLKERQLPMYRTGTTDVMGLVIPAGYLDELLEDGDAGTKGD